MSKVVRGVARIVFPFLATFSFYLIIHGHLTPGGGFQGGAVMASAMALLMVSYGIYGMKEKLLSISELTGLFALLVLLYFGSHFFHSLFEEWCSLPLGTRDAPLISAGIIPLMNLAVGLEVMCGVTLLLVLIRKGD